MTKDRVTEQMAAMPEEIKVQDDLLLEMMEYLLARMMEIEIINQRTGSEKNGHNLERTGYCSGYRSHRFGDRFGIINLDVPKLRHKQEPAMTLSQIADAVGYESVQHLCRVFRRCYHLSPSEYRHHVIAMR